jgi:hypothetical protein
MELSLILFSGLFTKPNIIKVAEHSPKFVNVTSERQTSQILSNIRLVSREGNNQPIIINLMNVNKLDVSIINGREWRKREGYKWERTEIVYCN